MLKIDTSSSNRSEIVVTLTGWVRREHLEEIERVVTQSLAAGRRIWLDLHDVSLVDREAVDFFAAGPGRFAALRSCPTYLREWLKAVGRDDG
jgi:anti-anti-sigma regulatory factor